MMKLKTLYACIIFLLVSGFFLSACNPSAVSVALPLDTSIAPVGVQKPMVGSLPPPQITPFATRPAYSPGELVDYIAQTGDNLPALSVHFNTNVKEILEANPFIPAEATTLPPGMPMKIPIYYAPFWGNPYQILPDSLFVNGPAQVSFKTQDFVEQHPGWLRGYREWADNDNRNGSEIIDLVAKNFSISPRLFLALLDYQNGALTQPAPSPEAQEYPLGYINSSYKGLYMQLVWAANLLNNGYYGWRTGHLTTFELLNGRIERPDPWQNAASVSIQYYFSHLMAPESYAQAISPNGLAHTYSTFFGDPWQGVQPHIPGSLVQPKLNLPFQTGQVWAFTGGPHTSWGDGDPLSALDFAPPSLAGGCIPTSLWATAIAPGVVARSETGIVVLDLDGDGDERTGWAIFYLHVGGEDRVQQGKILKTGDPIGHPSCEGGQATGTHVHIARKYNGEWIPAEGTLAFNLEGWIARDGVEPYLGTLTRSGKSIIACVCSDQRSHIESINPP